MVKLTPPMGWNSWNFFGANISDAVIRETADALVDSGLAAAGYEYVVIDDFWSLPERDENGRLVPDPVKFPHGLRALSDYIHAKGLKFGIYSCAGSLTCGGQPGSFDHEYIDAASFAEWGVDFLKEDFCYHSSAVSPAVQYRRMAAALDNCGREILLAACSWGSENTARWIRETGASMWRSTGDIFDNWERMSLIVKQQFDLLPYGGVGCFNDMDMLIVGMKNSGNVALGGCTDEEYRFHMDAWAFFGSPLMIGCDVRSIDEETKRLLTNPELLAINQDPACRQAFRLSSWESNQHTFGRLLADGSFAVGMFNLQDYKMHHYINADELGVPVSSGKVLRARDVWTGEEYRMPSGVLKFEVPPHASRLLRVRMEA